MEFINRAHYYTQMPSFQDKLGKIIAKIEGKKKKGTQRSLSEQIARGDLVAFYAQLRDARVASYISARLLHTTTTSPGSRGRDGFVTRAILATPRQQSLL